MSYKQPSFDKIAKNFSYDPESGLLVRRKTGKPTGRLSVHGYVVVYLKQREYLAHRLIWLLMTGSSPSGDIDHINGCRSDNRWGNLRDVGKLENSRNARLRRGSKSGHCGVTWNEEKQQWHSRINDRNASIHLGFFDRVNDAIKARKAAERRLGYHKNHGRI